MSITTISIDTIVLIFYIFVYTVILFININFDDQPYTIISQWLFVQFPQVIYIYIYIYIVVLVL